MCSESLGTTRSQPAPAYQLADVPDARLVLLAQANNNEAANALFSRHYPAFLRHAEALCRDPNDAEDLCQEACLKAFLHLSDLRNPGAFCAWVLARITNEGRHWQRNLNKVGTTTLEIGPSNTETMIVEETGGCAEDMESVMAFLARQSDGTDEHRRKIAAFMLRSYAEDHEFPSVRATSTATHTKLSTTQRRQRSLMVAWRRDLSSAGLSPSL